MNVLVVVAERIAHGRKTGRHGGRLVPLVATVVYLKTGSQRDEIGIPRAGPYEDDASRHAVHALSLRTFVCDDSHGIARQLSKGRARPGPSRTRPIA